jgi:hypothetical protein
MFTQCPCIALYIEEFSAGQNYIVTILAARDNDSVRVAMCSTLEQSTRMSPSSCNQERAVRPRGDFLKFNFSKIKKTIFNFSKISKKNPKICTFLTIHQNVHYCAIDYERKNISMKYWILMFKSIKNDQIILLKLFILAGIISINCNKIRFFFDFFWNFQKKKNLKDFGWFKLSFLCSFLHELWSEPTEIGQ